MKCVYPEFAGHWFEGGLADILRGAGRCGIHDRICTVDQLSRDNRADLFTCGPPCRPFSKARANRREVPPHLHPEFAILLSTLAVIRLRSPRGGFLEEVPGILTAIDGHDEQGRPLPHSWAVFIQDQLRAMNYFVAPLLLDGEIWIEFPRPRCPVPQCVRGVAAT